MKKIIAFLLILGTAYTLLNCMEKEEKTLEESFQALTIYPEYEYKRLKEKLADMTANSEDYIARLMQDYSLSKKDAEQEFKNAHWEQFRKAHNAFLKLKNK